MTRTARPIFDRGSRTHRRAFTLVEVLATIAFIAVVLPIAMHGVSLSVRAAGLAKRTAEATMIAQNRLDEMAAFPQMLPASTVEEVDGGYRVETRVNPVDPVSLGLDLRDFSVRVSWADRGGAERSVVLSTYVYGTDGL